MILINFIKKITGKKNGTKEAKYDKNTHILLLKKIHQVTINRLVICEQYRTLIDHVIRLDFLLKLQ